jgi:AAA domain
LVAGLPFARKSWAALELAHKVAAGRGEVFARCPIVRSGPVVYVWQDDSLSKELERLQLYASRHEHPDGLPLRFLLNEGVQLPTDVDELAGLIETEGAVLLVVDSLYNALAPTVKLKEEEVAVVLAQIKAGICDRTGATVCLVDHAPWPTEGNRGQRRAYGSVFKTAAVRWSIHLEADAKDDTCLHVEASGNNVAGFRRTPAIWNEDALEIRLLDVERVSEEELDEQVLAWVCEHPGMSTKKVAEGVGKRRENVVGSLERLGTLSRVLSKASRELGRPGTGRY